jgi:hypothetical protein
MAVSARKPRFPSAPRRSSSTLFRWSFPGRRRRPTGVAGSSKAWASSLLPHAAEQELRRRSQQEIIAVLWIERAAERVHAKLNSVERCRRRALTDGDPEIEAMVSNLDIGLFVRVKTPKLKVRPSAWPRRACASCAIALSPHVEHSAVRTFTARYKLPWRRRCQNTRDRACSLASPC